MELGLDLWSFQSSAYLPFLYACLFSGHNETVFWGNLFWQRHEGGLERKELKQETAEIQVAHATILRTTCEVGRH